MASSCCRCSSCRRVGYEDAPKRRSKRQRLLSHLKNSTIPTKEIEDFINRRSKNNKTTALFSVRPCDIKQAQFRQLYGMIEICNQMPSYDRFRSTQMSDETLSCIASLVGSDVAYSTEFQRSSGKEQQEAPILDRLARNLGRFTKPLRPQEEEPAYGTKDEELQKKADCAIEYAAIGHLDPETEGTSADQLISSQSSEEQEGLAQSSSDANPRQHPDLKVSVFKRRHTLGGLRLKVVMDWKSGAEMEHLFQPAVYAIDALRPTTGYSKAFRPPVYLMAHDTHKWYYGILEIDGYIKVKNGKFNPVAFDDFPVGAQQVDNKKFTRSITRSEVEAQFEKWTVDMARNDMYVPDGLHPVGRLFFPLVQNDELPSLSSDQTLTSGRKRYFDGMLKILVGRRVIQWTPDDASDAWNARSYLQEKAFQTSGLPEKYWGKALGRV